MESSEMNINLVSPHFPLATLLSAPSPDPARGGGGEGPGASGGNWAVIESRGPETEANGFSRPN